MSGDDERFWDIFFEVYAALPRQGPGNRACAERALGLCRDLPPEPRILDLGCGVGGQTLHLAELTRGSIVAIDRHTPWIEQLQRTAQDRGLQERIRPVVADMAQPPCRPESFDLVWSEGALYNLGIETALQVCRAMLRPGGSLAFTDAVWLKEDPPAEVRDAFDLDYPTMGRAEQAAAAVERAGFELLDRFTLPDQAWWDDFYGPMEKRLAELRQRYAGDSEALGVLEQIGREVELHRLYSDYYGYEFFVAQRRQ